MKLTLLVPAYNEEKRIEEFLLDLIEYGMKSEDVVEILVVDDGSTDRTPKILKNYGHQIKIVRHKKNLGKGAAIKTGVLAATGDYIVFMDADGSTGTNQLPKMLAALKKNTIVVGNRLGKESKITNSQPLRRQIAGKVFNFIVNILFPINYWDCLCGFKGMRAKEGKEIASEMISTDWVFDVEIIARAKKKKFGFGVIPVEWHHEKDSKMKLGWTNVKMFLNLLKLRKAL
ncbi:MAG: glycosyltransferase [Candidatus Diapherotrites archaeon]